MSTPGGLNAEDLFGEDLVEPTATVEPDGAPDEQDTVPLLEGLDYNPDRVHKLQVWRDGEYLLTVPRGADKDMIGSWFGSGSYSFRAQDRKGRVVRSSNTIFLHGDNLPLGSDELNERINAWKAVNHRLVVAPEPQDMPILKDPVEIERARAEREARAEQARLEARAQARRDDETSEERAENRHRRDMERIKAEAESRAAEIERRHKMDMEALDRRHQQDVERMKQEAAERVERDRMFFATLKENTDKVVSLIVEQSKAGAQTKDPLSMITEVAKLSKLFNPAPAEPDFFDQVSKIGPILGPVLAAFAQQRQPAPQQPPPQKKLPPAEPTKTLEKTRPIVTEEERDKEVSKLLQRLVMMFAEGKAPEEGHMLIARLDDNGQLSDDAVAILETMGENEGDWDAIAKQAGDPRLAQWLRQVMNLTFGRDQENVPDARNADPAASSGNATA